MELVTTLLAREHVLNLTLKANGYLTNEDKYESKRIRRHLRFLTMEDLEELYSSDSEDVRAAIERRERIMIGKRVLDRFVAFLDAKGIDLENRFEKCLRELALKPNIVQTSKMVKRWKKRLQYRFGKHKTFLGNLVSPHSMAVSIPVSSDSRVSLAFWKCFNAEMESAMNKHFAKHPWTSSATLSIDLAGSKSVGRITVSEVALAAPLALLSDLDNTKAQQALVTLIPKKLGVSFERVERPSALSDDYIKMNSLIKQSSIEVLQFKLFAPHFKMNFAPFANGNRLPVIPNNDRIIVAHGTYGQIFMLSFATAIQHFRVTFAIYFDSARSALNLVGIYFYHEYDMAKTDVQEAKKKLRIGTKCINCDEKDATSWCRMCIDASYCGQECADAHWSTHKCFGKK